MARRYDFEWIDRDAEQGPVFRIGRDVYIRERPGQSLIRLPALETYPARVAPVAAQAFIECARAWEAPITFVIEPNLKRPPAVRFLYEWSTTTARVGAVERSFMGVTNTLTRWMGALVLRVFTDGSMPFEAIEGEEALQRRLDQLDLSCPRPGYTPPTSTQALVRAGDAPPSLLRFLLGRAARRVRGR